MGEGMLRADTVLTRTPGVLCERVGDAFLLLDPREDRYVRLNGTGGWVFERLAEPQSPAELARRLTAERGAPVGQALEDVLAFAGDLVRRGVLQRA